MGNGRQFVGARLGNSTCWQAMHGMTAQRSHGQHASHSVGAHLRLDLEAIHSSKGPPPLHYLEQRHPKRVDLCGWSGEDGHARGALHVCAEQAPPGRPRGRIFCMSASCQGPLSSGASAARLPPGMGTIRSGDANAAAGAAQGSTKIAAGTIAASTHVRFEDARLILGRVLPPLAIARAARRLGVEQLWRRVGSGADHACGTTRAAQQDAA